MSYEAECDLCGTVKTYKTKQGYEKYKDKLCRSCANSIAHGGTGNVKARNGIKKCTNCEEYLPVDKFFVVSGRPQSTCKNCTKEKSSSYIKNVYRFKKYDITKEEFKSIKESQNGKCYICQEDKKLCIDHNHNTGEVRGLLCRTCNSALGIFNNINKLERALKYLGENSETR